MSLNGKIIEKLNESSIFGFKEFREDELFGSEASTHAMLLLHGLEEYYNRLIDAYHEDSFAFQGIEDIKALEDAQRYIQEAIQSVNRANGNEEE